MEVTSQADAGEARPRTPEFQTASEKDEDFLDSFTPKAAQKHDTEGGEERASDAVGTKTGSHEDEASSEGEFTDFEWADLQNRYDADMENQTQTEREIEQEFAKLIAVCDFAYRRSTIC